MINFLKQIVTCKDNETHDIGRWSWVLSFLAVVIIGLWQVIDGMQYLCGNLLNPWDLCRGHTAPRSGPRKTQNHNEIYPSHFTCLGLIFLVHVP